MKKSMLNVITLALVLVNLILTVLLTFSLSFLMRFQPAKAAKFLLME